MTAAVSDLMIREFIPGDEIAFRRLNEEGISRYFTLESKDVEILANPRQKILEHGGRIFFAVLQGETVGCCALLAIGPGQFTFHDCSRFLHHSRGWSKLHGKRQLLQRHRR